MRTILLVLLLGGCAAGAPLPPHQSGVRASSAALALDAPYGPQVYTPPGQITAPAASVSRRCVPYANGLGADCQAL